MQILLLHSRLRAARFLPLFGRYCGRGLFCFLVGLMLIQPLLAQTITTVAGTGGVPGFNSDGIAATSAQLNTPYGVAVDAMGNFYIADTVNDRIRKVTPAGIISTVAGGGSAFGEGGQATSAQLSFPSGVAVDAADNLYIADTGNHRIRKVDVSTGFINTVAGTAFGFSGDGGPATSAQLDSPRGVAVDGAGNLLIADRNNHRIRKVDVSTGNISTVAGTLTFGFSGDGGPATSAQLDGPVGVAFDGAGNPFIADTQNNRIRKVSVVNPCTDANLPTVTIVFNNSATVMGTGIPTITVPNTPGQQFQVLGGNSFEFVTVIDRINGY